MCLALATYQGFVAVLNSDQLGRLNSILVPDIFLQKQRLLLTSRWATAPVLFMILNFKTKRFSVYLLIKFIFLKIRQKKFFGYFSIRLLWSNYICDKKGFF